MDPSRVTEIVRRHYGLSVQAEPLTGYDDLNFRLTATDGLRYVFKLSSPEAEAEYLRAQCQLLKDLFSKACAAGISVPRLIPSLRGEPMITLYLGGKRRYLRLMGHVDGELFARVDPSPQLYFSLGELLGILGRLLGDYCSPVLEARRSEWDLAHASHVLALTKYIQNNADRRRASYVLNRFSRQVAPALASLRKSVLHNDANGWNVTVVNGRASGIFDFGDVVYSHTVNELAIGAAYAIIRTDDALAAAQEILRGYHGQLPIREGEVRLLYYLVALRLAVSITMSSYALQKDPDNEYIAIDRKPALNALSAWLDLSAEGVERSLRSIIIAGEQKSG